jgi:hypothetical protein
MGRTLVFGALAARQAAAGGIAVGCPRLFVAPPIEIREAINFIV